MLKAKAEICYNNIFSPLTFSWAVVAGWSTLGTALTVACFFPDIDMPPPTPVGMTWAGTWAAPSTNGMSPFAIVVAEGGGADDVIALLIPATVLGVVDVGDTGEVGVVGCSVATGDEGVAKDDCC